MGSSGFHVPAIRMEQPSSSGQQMVFSTDCALRLQHVVADATGTIQNHGFATVGTSKPVTLAAPVKGANVKVMFDSSKQSYIKCGGSAYINTTGLDVISIIATKAAAAGRGCVLEFVGASTALWYLAGIGASASGPSTTTGWLVKLSSST